MSQQATMEASINLPQIIVLTVIGFLAVRWLFFSRTPSDASGNRTANGTRVNPVHVEQLLSMFPQLDRRTIMWELQRNGGSVQVATEKVLTGRGLERPPQTFQPPMPASTAPTSAPGRPATTAQPKSLHPDLITKYNLSSKLNEASSPSDASPDVKGKKPGWSNNKEERQSLLQKRREEMILAARRKMEEQDRLEKEAKS